MSSARARIPGLSGTVLVVEDEGVVRLLLCQILERYGTHVLEACDGPSGLRQFLENRGNVGLVVLDMGLPGMHGSEDLASMRKAVPDVPVVVCTGYERPVTIPGDVGFVAKTFSLPGLQAGIREALAIRR